MKIDSNKEQLSRLNDKLRNQIITKEREIENAKSFYDKKLENTKAEKERDFLIQRNEQEQRLAKLINQREEQLNKTKNNIGQTNEMLQKQKQQLESKYDKDLERATLEQNLKLENKQRQGIDEAKEINQRTNDLVQQMQREYRDRMEAIEHQTRQHMLQAQAKAEREKLEIDKKYDNASLAVTHNQHKKEKLNAEDELQNSLKEMKNEYQKIEKDYDQLHKNELNLSRNQQTNDLQRSEQVFDAKYENMIKEHKELFQTTKSKLEQEFKQLIDKHTELRQTYSQKVDDQFYRAHELSPKIKDLGDSYQVDIEIAEHEKENVRVAPQERMITVSINRRFQQRIDEDGGGFQKTQRTELLSKTLQTSDILDPSNITQKYEDGVLSFKIQKA